MVILSLSVGSEICDFRSRRSVTSSFRFWSIKIDTTVVFAVQQGENKINVGCPRKNEMCKRGAQECGGDGGRTANLSLYRVRKVGED